MRVIAGTAGGTRLYGAKGYKIRPVIDRVKEAVFNLVADRLKDANVLDLFAGIGNFGIEALSRGAAHADFIEQHRATAGSIRDNLERAHLGDRGTVIVARLPGGLKRLSASYGLIFADPPFRIDCRLMEELFNRVLNDGLLEEGGILVYRHSPHYGVEPSSDLWELLDRREYGDSIVSIYCISSK